MANKLEIRNTKSEILIKNRKILQDLVSITKVKCLGEEFLWCSLS